MAKYEHIVTEEEVGLSVNTILRLNYRFSSRFRTKMKYQSLVDLNGAPVAGYIKPDAGDVIGVRLPQETSDFEPEDIALEVIYEDDDLLIINKQPGIIVHPTKGHPVHTIANAVMKYMNDSGQSFKIRFANRIDMDTTGIVIVAKNANAQNDISAQMRRGTVVKKYLALVEGCPSDDHFTIDLPIGRPSPESIRRTVMETGGKNAISEINMLEKYPSAEHGLHSLVEVILHTGRTHQIRVHLSHTGNPIAGDTLYGGSTGLIDRQALHAYHIEFDHPLTKERISFEAPMYPDMKAAIQKLKSGSDEL